MNKVRRKSIEKLLESVAVLHDQIDRVLTEEQESFDNLPEGIQYSERGDAMQEAIDALESALSSCEEIDEYLTDAMEH